MTQAQYNIGMSYRDGEGVERDIARALHHLSLAAASDDPEVLVYA
jgi:TPR repeat protein